MADISTDTMAVRQEQEVHLYPSMCPSILFDVEEMAYVR